MSEGLSLEEFVYSKPVPRTNSKRQTDRQTDKVKVVQAAPFLALTNPDNTNIVVYHADCAHFLYYTSSFTLTNVRRQHVSHSKQDSAFNEHSTKNNESRKSCCILIPAPSTNKIGVGSCVLTPASVSREISRI